MNIVLIGSGNVATHLGMALNGAGKPIVQVYSQTLINAQKLALKVGAKATDTIVDIDTTASIYILSLKDDALEAVIKKMPEVKGVVVHTAGSVDMKVLNRFAKHGVFYPFQTFSIDKAVDFSTIPILWEAGSDSVVDILRTLASALSPHVHEVSSLQRGKLHIAAVFACNFVNHMYRMADELLLESELSFDLLKPLILETANKVMDMPPGETQTGPASRTDMKVIEKHRDMLKSNEPFYSTYNTITQLILSANNDY